MQVFHIWPLVTERSGRRYLESLFAKVVSEAQLKQALPFAWMFAKPLAGPQQQRSPPQPRERGRCGGEGWERVPVPLGIIRGCSAKVEAEGKEVALALSRRWLGQAFASAAVTVGSTGGLQKSEGRHFGGAGASVSSERLKQWQLFRLAGYAVYWHDENSHSPWLQVISCLSEPFWAQATPPLLFPSSTFKSCSPKHRKCIGPAFSAAHLRERERNIDLLENRARLQLLHLSYTNGLIDD